MEDAFDTQKQPNPSYNDAEVDLALQELQNNPNQPQRPIDGNLDFQGQINEVQRRTEAGNFFSRFIIGFTQVVTGVVGGLIGRPENGNAISSQKSSVIATKDMPVAVTPLNGESQNFEKRAGGPRKTTTTTTTGTTSTATQAPTTTTTTAAPTTTSTSTATSTTTGTTSTATQAPTTTQATTATTTTATTTTAAPTTTNAVASTTTGTTSTATQAPTTTSTSTATSTTTGTTPTATQAPTTTTNTSTTAAPTTTTTTTAAPTTATTTTAAPTTTTNTSTTAVPTTTQATTAAPTTTTSTTAAPTTTTTTLVAIESMNPFQLTQYSTKAVSYYGEYYPFSSQVNVFTDLNKALNDYVSNQSDGNLSGLKGALISFKNEVESIKELVIKIAKETTNNESSYISADQKAEGVAAIEIANGSDYTNTSFNNLAKMMNLALKSKFGGDELHSDFSSNNVALGPLFGILKDAQDKLASADASTVSAINFEFERTIAKLGGKATNNSVSLEGQLASFLKVLCKNIVDESKIEDCINDSGSKIDSSFVALTTSTQAPTTTTTITTSTASATTAAPNTPAPTTTTTTNTAASTTTGTTSTATQAPTTTTNTSTTAAPTTTATTTPTPTTTTTTNTAASTTTSTKDSQNDGVAESAGAPEAESSQSKNNAGAISGGVIAGLVVAAIGAIAQIRNKRSKVSHLPIANNSPVSNFPAFSRDHVAANHATGDWFGPAVGGVDSHVFTDFATTTTTPTPTPAPLEAWPDDTLTTPLSSVLTAPVVRDDSSHRMTVDYDQGPRVVASYNVGNLSGFPAEKIGPSDEFVANDAPLSFSDSTNSDGSRSTGSNSPADSPRHLSPSYSISITSSSRLSNGQGFVAESNV